MRRAIFSPDRFQQTQLIADREAQFLEIVSCQVSQNVRADVVVGKGVAIFSESQAGQPGTHIVYQIVPSS